jgi:hypothetical protein
MARWTITLLAVAFTSVFASAAHAARCLDVTIESGKTYEFAVNEFGQATPISVVPKKNGTTFVMRKTYLEPSEVGATGQFDSCELAEAFAQSAKKEVDAAVESMEKLPFGKLFKGLGEGLRELGVGAHEFKFKKEGYHAKSCVKLQGGGEDCIESTDPEEFKRLKEERDRRLRSSLEQCLVDNQSLEGMRECVKDRPDLRERLDRLEQLRRQQR